MPGARPAHGRAQLHISPETFDQLTVIKGPQTVGPRRLGRHRALRPRHAALHRGRRALRRADRRLVRPQRPDADFTAGNESVYVRVTGNHSHSQDYKDGNGLRVPSRWDKWNTDLALGTPDADTLFELTAGTGDGEARYGGGAWTARSSSARASGCFEKRNLGATLEKIEAQLYYNYADHVMDNYSCAGPDPTAPCRWRWPTWTAPPGAAARRHACWPMRPTMTGGLDFQQSRHRAAAAPTRTHRNQSWGKGRRVQQRRPVLGLTWRASEHGRLIGARVDRASAKDFRPTGHMMMMPNPTAGERRDSTLQRLPALRAGPGEPAGHLVRGPGPCAALPRLLGVAVPAWALPARSTPST